MTAWIGFGIAVGFTAAVALVACALVFGALAIHRLACFLCRRAWQHPETASDQFWAAVARGDTFRTDAIKERIARISLEESR